MKRLAAILVRLADGYGRHRHAYNLALVVLCGALAYGNSLQVPFYFDDFDVIVSNPFVHHPGNLRHLADYRQLGVPEDIRNNVVTRLVAYLTFAANYRLHGLWLPGYHLVNLLLHLANAALCYLLALATFRSGRSDRLAPAADPAGLALVSALLFVLHPVATGAVTYITQRFIVLATFLGLLGLAAYRRAALAETAGGRRLWFGAALGCVVAAMYTNETAFTLPLLIVLYDLAFLDGSGGARVRRGIPLLLTMSLLPATVAFLAAHSQITGESVARALELANLDAISRRDYFVTQWRVVSTYLRLMLFPAGLNADRDQPLLTSPLESEAPFSGLFNALLLTGGILLLLRPGRSGVCGKAAGFGLVWFYVTLAMTSSLIPLSDLAVEYRLYLPSVGLILAAAAGGSWLLRPACRSVRGRRTVLGLALVVVLLLGSATWRRNQVWGENLLLWTDVVSKSPDKPRPRINLAGACLERGRVEEALRHLEIAAASPRSTWRDHFEVARRYSALGLLEEAAAELRAALALNPRETYIHGILGRVYLALGKTAEAAAAFNRGLAADPGNPELLQALEDLGLAPAPVSPERSPDAR
jgi:hypothetical protein